MQRAGKKFPAPGVCAADRDDSSVHQAAAHQVPLDPIYTGKMMFGIFKGKNSWITILIAIVQLLWFGVFVYCAIQFFKATETTDLIRWGVFGSLSIMASSMLKFYTWMQMDKKALLREIKRLELQVSSLSGKISK